MFTWKTKDDYTGVSCGLVHIAAETIGLQGHIQSGTLSESQVFFDIFFLSS